jgi:hypothetical protein
MPHVGNNPYVNDPPVPDAVQREARRRADLRALASPVALLLGDPVEGSQQSALEQKERHNADLDHWILRMGARHGRGISRTGGACH